MSPLPPRVPDERPSAIVRISVRSPLLTVERVEAPVTESPQSVGSQVKLEECGPGRIETMFHPLPALPLANVKDVLGRHEQPLTVECDGREGALLSTRNRADLPVLAVGFDDKASIAHGDNPVL